MHTYSLRLMVALSSDQLVAVSLVEDVYVRGQKVSSDLLSLKNRDPQDVEDELTDQLRDLLLRLRRRGAMQPRIDPNQDTLPIVRAHRGPTDSAQLHGTARYGH